MEAMLFWVIRIIISVFFWFSFYNVVIMFYAKKKNVGISTIKLHFSLWKLMIIHPPRLQPLKLSGDCQEVMFEGFRWPEFRAVFQFW